MKNLTLVRGFAFSVGLFIAQQAIGAAANSCTSYIPAASSGQIVTASVTTMNTNRVVSYASAIASYVPARPRGRLGIYPASWVATMPQVFSDRGTVQKFDVSQSDKVTVIVPIADSPTVTFILNSHGNVYSTFTAVCNADGVLHGSSSTVDYLIGFQIGPPIQ